MSLIHKALRKVEKPSSVNSNDILKSEEELMGSGGEFKSLKITPRVLMLAVLILIVAGYAIYSNYAAFCAKKGGVPIPEKPAKVSKEANSKEAAKLPVAPAVPRRSAVSGITEHRTQSLKVELPPEVDKLNEEAKQLFMAGNFDAALGKFTEALTLVENSSEILNSIGLVYKKKGDLDRAEKYYTEAIKYNQWCAECENNLGVLRLDKNDKVSAVLHFKKAINLSETYADPYFNLAVIMENEGNFKSAIENYKKFMVYTSPDNVELKAKVREKIEDLALRWEDQ